MKKMILLAYLLFSLSSLFAFTWKDEDTIAVRDSIMKEVELLPADTSRLSRLLKVTYLNQFPPGNLYFARRLYEEAVKQNNLFYENMGAYYLAICYDKKHELDTLTYWVDKLEEFAPQIGKYDYYLEQKAAISRVMASKKMVEKAVFVAKEVLKESQERKSNNGIVAAYNSLSCAYSVSKRPDESLRMLLKGYKACNRTTKLSLSVDILSRLVSQYANRAMRDSSFYYLEKMNAALNTIVANEPETMDNWRDVMVDCQTKYMRYYMNKKDFPQTEVYLEKAKALLTPYVDTAYWLNVKLMELQYYGRIKEYDKGIALVDEVTPVVVKTYIETYELLIQYKSTLLWGKGEQDASLENLKGLLHKQDSMSLAFSTNQLKEVKEIYHIDELLLEKQKIANTNHVRAVTILIILLGLMALFYVYTKQLSRKIAKAEKEAAEAAALSNADNQAKERLKLEISHDIRTPLNAVVGFAEILAETGDLDEDSKREYNKIIQENACQLLDYVNNILELSRLESGKIKYTRENCEFIGLCREAVQMANATEKNCVRAELHTDIDKQMIDTDKTRLLLLLNSLMVTTVDEEFYHVTITVQRKEEKSLLLVKVVNTPLAKERFENKTAMIRNEINTHFIHSFGGYYKVDALAKEGPTVVFAYPYS